ncbi:MAG TPA: rod shape-determining protein MreD [Phycisphaerae bacterium]|nr:rod shape-determining protein MreD [Phycisphaerae bacterium]
MRWIRFAILAYLVVLLQTTVAQLVRIPLGPVGAVRPDFLAMVALFVCLAVGGIGDAMLAAWVLGMLVDLTTGGGPGAATVVGPMALAYALAAALIFRIREAFFRERIVTRMVLGFLFCVVAHGLWVTAQSLAAAKQMTWGAYWTMLLQVVAVSVYTGAVTPILLVGLTRLERQLIVTPAGRARR